MKDKIWDIEHGGRRIRVINRISILPPRTSEALEIDGKLVAENQGNLLRMFSILGAEVEFHGTRKQVEARIAQKVGIPRTGCHILVNDELVGGDIETSLALPDLDAAKKQYAQGATRYILTSGLFGYGLPFALLMTIFNRPESTTGLIIGFLIQFFGFGLAMGWVMWRSIKSRAEKLDR
jgi:hypothetical protein